MLCFRGKSGGKKSSLFNYSGKILFHPLTKRALPPSAPLQRRQKSSFSFCWFGYESGKTLGKTKEKKKVSAKRKKNIF